MNRATFTNHLGDADKALQQADAMVSMTYGDEGEAFRNLQDTYLWTLAERIEAAVACDERATRWASRCHATRRLA